MEAVASALFREVKIELCLGKERNVCVSKSTTEIEVKCFSTILFTILIIFS